jgi:hypothetical protein
LRIPTLSIDESRGSPGHSDLQRESSAESTVRRSKGSNPTEGQSAGPGRRADLRRVQIDIGAAELRPHSVGRSQRSHQLRHSLLEVEGRQPAIAKGPPDRDRVAPRALPRRSVRLTLSSRQARRPLRRAASELLRRQASRWPATTPAGLSPRLMGANGLCMNLFSIFPATPVISLGQPGSAAKARPTSRVRLASALAATAAADPRAVRSRAARHHHP